MRTPPGHPAEGFTETAQTCVCMNLRKAARAVTQRYEAALRPAGLRATQFTLLAALHVSGPSTISRLAEELVMDRTTLTRNLRPLLQQGLLSLQPGKVDAREREVRLTQAGRARLAKAFPLWKRAQQQMVQSLGINRVERLLCDMAAAVKATEQS